mmetsp:Transcript_81331/g.126882  ORF Transcript_81331/g.126882 Transcript_81331/m.126882 type:complete len:98 (+) Transcript_81331:25-318(+)
MICISGKGAASLIQACTNFKDIDAMLILQNMCARVFTCARSPQVGRNSHILCDETGISWHLPPILERLPEDMKSHESIAVCAQRYVATAAMDLVPPT